jgi:23S rRNA pseudouridine2604 synthase
MPDSDAIRLNKRMTELGLCSRREADAWIERGWVRVNGQPAVLGSKVVPADRITVSEAARQAQQGLMTVLLHKPIGYVSGQAEDGYEPAAVLVTPDRCWPGGPGTRGARRTPAPRSLAPAGRLDIDSTGLLVLTQDGRVARQLIGEDSSVEKEYLVRVRFGAHDQEVSARFPADRLRLLRHGLTLDGKPLRPAHVDWQNPEQLRFVLREGKKRQIRRMCELVGLEVTGLKRVRVGGVLLGQVPLGQWRLLGPGERF